MKKARFLGFLISLLFIGWSFLAWTGKFVPFFKRKKEDQLQKFLSACSSKDFLIIFNSGGWGHTSLEKATDFRSIIWGIQKELNRRGYSSLVIPYIRAKETLFGKVLGIKDISSFFGSQSKYLAKQIDKFLHVYPDKKIIMAGLSMGALFVDETMKRVKKKESVFAIKIGMPFYADHILSENIIEISEEEDALARGEGRILFFSTIRGLKKWFSAKIKGEPLTLSKAVNIPGHHLYSWDYHPVKEKIIDFLENRVCS